MTDKKSKVGEKKVVSCRWREKVKSREEMMKYLQTADRYWYSDDWYGSEKRKNPA